MAKVAIGAFTENAYFRGKTEQVKYAKQLTKDIADCPNPQNLASFLYSIWPVWAKITKFTLQKCQKCKNRKITVFHVFLGVYTQTYLEKMPKMAKNDENHHFTHLQKFMAIINLTKRPQKSVKHQKSRKITEKWSKNGQKWVCRDVSRCARHFHIFSKPQKNPVSCGGFWENQQSQEK